MKSAPTITISCDELVTFSDDANAPPEDLEVIIIPPIPRPSTSDAAPIPTAEIPPQREMKS